MSTQEQMFADIENWQNSGKKKSEFLKDKNYGAAKFNYWLTKWNASKSVQGDEFSELTWREVKVGKVLEIIAPSGVKITVFA
jgi:hypothetical protein